MKHPSSRGFFAYWDAKRGDARAPDRIDIDPGAVREPLGDIFVLSCDNEAGYPFRMMWFTPLIGGVTVVLVSVVAAAISVRPVLKLEPGVVFAGR